MLAWLRNVNIAILASHVSWTVLTSSTLVAQPCICNITLNGHVRISNLHCQFLCCCALLEVEISLKNLSQNATPEVAWRFTHQPDYFCTTSFLFTRARNIFLEFVGIINFGAFCWPRYCMVASHSLCSLPSYSLRKYHACWLGMSLYGSYIYF